MAYPLHVWFCYLLPLLALCSKLSQAKVDKNGMRSSVFLSPEFVMRPGSVVNNYYHDIDFQRGHIGLKSFNAEVVDDTGNSVPLQETYLHHWVVLRYHQRKGADQGKKTGLKFQQTDIIVVRNSGICQNKVLGQYFGLGSETRKTETLLPNPYAIEIGNPSEIPDGYEEKWMLNVHAIGTHGVVDRLGCIECRCDLYNVTKDEYGRPLSPNYKGGLNCCYDQTQCRVRIGTANVSRTLYLKYTVKWIDWHKVVLPVKIYIFDITDTWEMSSPEKSSSNHSCKVEYEIHPCNSSADGCIDTKNTRFVMPKGGYVIYGVAHQHSGGVGSNLYGEDGRVICSSLPSYGNGKEAGNEAGYIVGMSTCYPSPGSVKVFDGETLVLISNYSSTQVHTGVMGLFYVLIADQVPSSKSFLAVPSYRSEQAYVPISAWIIVVLGIMFVTAIILGIQGRNQDEDVYRLISIGG